MLKNIGSTQSFGFATRLALTLLLCTAPSFAFAATDSEPIWLGELGGSVYFIAQPQPLPLPAPLSSTIYKTDGTAVGTTALVSFNGVGISGGASFINQKATTVFIPAGNKAYFLASTVHEGEEVWVTHGTGSGTHMIADLSVGPNNGSPTLLGLIGTDLIFAETLVDNSLQVFRTDGTASGTHALTTFLPGQYGFVSDSLVINGKVYVALDSNNSCCQPDLWATDGTVGGTVQIDSDEGYPWHLQPSSLRPFNVTTMMMLTDTEFRGTELSLVDTTTNALTILETIPGALGGAQLGSTIAVMDGFALYAGNSTTSGFEPSRSDGTLAGSTLVKDIAPGVANSLGLQNAQNTRIGNHAVFTADDGTGIWLWSSDGTAAGTFPLIATPNAVVNPLLGVVGTHGYYAVYTGTDYRVVVTDGTPAGTLFLTAAGPLDPNSLNNTQLAGNDNLVFLNTYFVAAGASTHLFAYAPQTQVLTPLRDAALNGEEVPPLLSGGRLYFKSNDPRHGEEPWVSDGTLAGTHILANIAPETPNTSPVAADDTASSTNGAAVTINVVGNDTDSGGSIDSTSVHIESPPVHGSASVTASGSVLYTPNAGFVGADTFTYIESDDQGAVSNVATVTVTASQSAPASSGGGGGGGGGMDMTALLALAGLVARRLRWQPKAS